MHRQCGMFVLCPSFVLCLLSAHPQTWRTASVFTLNSQSVDFKNTLLTDPVPGVMRNVSLLPPTRRVTHSHSLFHTLTHIWSFPARGSRFFPTGPGSLWTQTESLVFIGDFILAVLLKLNYFKYRLYVFVITPRLKPASYGLIMSNLKAIKFSG